MPAASASAKAPTGPPDAVVFHDALGFHNDPAFGGKLRSANDRYAPMLGCQRIRVYASSPAMPYQFGIPACDGPGQSVFFPSEHPLSGQSRYTWYPATPDGKGGWTIAGEVVESPNDHDGRVLFGWLRPEAKDAP